MQFTVHKGSDKYSNPDKWFEMLYHERAEHLLRYAYSITEDKALAEDVVSEIFTTFWNKREELSQANDPQAYLARSVRNLAIRKVSQSSKEQSFDLADEARQKHELDPESILIGRELEAVINEVIENLTPHGRLVYDMARNKGYSNDKIAKELGISKLTVNKHLSNVLKTFKIALSKHFKDSSDNGGISISKLLSTLILLNFLPEIAGTNW